LAYARSEQRFRVILQRCRLARYFPVRNPAADARAHELSLYVLRGLRRRGVAAREPPRQREGAGADFAALRQPALRVLQVLHTMSTACSGMQICIEAGGMKTSDMTLMQNDAQQHQREANQRQIRVVRGGKRSPDSEAACRELSNSGLDSHVLLQTCDSTSNFGGGTTTWAATCTRVRPSRIQ
jgi:hypothetical protein